MKNIDLTPFLKDKLKPYPRKKGRYNASELWAIVSKKRDGTPYLTPEQWLSPKQEDIKSLMRMWQGIVVHDHVQKLLTHGVNEAKIETKYKDIILVAKADHLPSVDIDEVWEFKTSEEEMATSKPWANYQCRLYTSIFEKTIGKIFQPVQNEHGLFLKHIGEVKRDDAWFKKQLEKLYAFHQEVEKLREAKTLLNK